MTAQLVPGERSIRHQVKIPESLDRKLRARAVLEGDLKISEVIRTALEAYLAPTSTGTTPTEPVAETTTMRHVPRNRALQSRSR